MNLVQILAVTTLAVALPVHANTVSIRVSHGDLDLTSAKGRATLDRRVARAIRRICGTNTSFNLHDMLSARSCVVPAEATARLQVEVAVARATDPVRVAAR